MKGIGLFILGFVAGILCTFFVLFLFALGSRHNEIPEKKHFEYVEIKGEKGNVQVHIGMPKDSVYILAGKPDEVNLMTIGNSTHETWNYKMTNKYVPDLSVEFEDGELTAVRQN